MITSEIESLFKTAGIIAVDTEFREVSLDVLPGEFDGDKMRNISTNRIDLKYSRCDKDTCMLYYSYIIKQP